MEEMRNNWQKMKLPVLGEREERRRGFSLGSEAAASGWLSS